MRRRLLALLGIITALVVAAALSLHYWTHRYDKLIAAVALRHDLDPQLVRAVVYEESFFSPRARSAQNAVGLMQVTPVAAQEMIETTHTHNLSEAVAEVSGAQIPVTASFEETMSEPATGLHVGCWYLHLLLIRYRDEPNSLAVALAAYNAGPANVERWAATTERLQLSREEFLGRIQFPATREYVRKVVDRYDDYRRR